MINTCNSFYYRYTNDNHVTLREHSLQPKSLFYELIEILCSTQNDKIRILFANQRKDMKWLQWIR